MYHCQWVCFFLCSQSWCWWCCALRSRECCSTVKIVLSLTYIIFMCCSCISLRTLFFRWFMRGVLTVELCLGSWDQHLIAKWPTLSQSWHTNLELLLLYHLIFLHGRDRIVLHCCCSFHHHQDRLGKWIDCVCCIDVVESFNSHFLRP